MASLPPTLAKKLSACTKPSLVTPIPLSNSETTTLIKTVQTLLKQPIIRTTSSNNENIPRNENTPPSSSPSIQTLLHVLTLSEHPSLPTLTLEKLFYHTLSDLDKRTSTPHTHHLTRYTLSSLARLLHPPVSNDLSPSPPTGSTTHDLAHTKIIIPTLTLAITLLAKEPDNTKHIPGTYPHTLETLITTSLLHATPPLVVSGPVLSLPLPLLTPLFGSIFTTLTTRPPTPQSFHTLAKALTILPPTGTSGTTLAYKYALKTLQYHNTLPPPTLTVFYKTLTYALTTAYPHTTIDGNVVELWARAAPHTTPQPPLSNLPAHTALLTSLTTLITGCNVTPKNVEWREDEYGERWGKGIRESGIVKYITATPTPNSLVYVTTTLLPLLKTLSPALYGEVLVRTHMALPYTDNRGVCDAWIATLEDVRGFVSDDCTPGALRKTVCRIVMGGCRTSGGEGGEGSWERLVAVLPSLNGVEEQGGWGRWGVLGRLFREKGWGCAYQTYLKAVCLYVEEIGAGNVDKLPNGVGEVQGFVNCLGAGEATDAWMEKVTGRDLKAIMRLDVWRDGGESLMDMVGRLTSNPATFLSVVKVLVAGLCARFKEKARTLTSCYCSQKLPNWSQVLNVYAEHAVCPDAYEFVLDLMPQVDDEWARLWTSVWAGRLALRHADQHIRDKGAASFTAAYANLKSMPASDAASEDKDKCLGVLRESFCYCRMTVETVMCGDDGSSLAPFCWRRAGFDNLVADAPSSNDVNALIVEILSRESATEVLAGVKSLEARAEALPTAPEHAFERIVTYLGMVECLSSINDLSGAAGTLKICVQTAQQMVKRSPNGLVWRMFLAELLTRLAVVWGRRGDRRRAEGYVCLAAECLEVCLGKGEEERLVLGNVEVVDHEGITITSSSNVLNEIIVERVSVRLSQLAQPAEKVTIKPKAATKPTSSPDRNVELVTALLERGDALRRTCDGVENGFMKEYEEGMAVLEMMRDEEFGALMMKSAGLKVPAHRAALPLVELMNALLVRQARGAEICGRLDRAREMYKEVARSNSASGVDRATAYYRLGRLSLEKGEEKGEVKALWEANNETPTPHCDAAHKLFAVAKELVGAGTTRLARKVLRCLVLTAGPNAAECLENLVHLHESVGASIRVGVAHELEAGKEKELFGFLDEFGRTDKEAVLASLAKEHMGEINCVILCVAPTGELLVGGLKKGGVATLGCVTEKRMGVYLTVLDELLEKSRRQLDGVDIKVAKSFGEKEKRDWWQGRMDVDKGLGELLSRVEDGLQPVLNVLLGNSASTSTTGVSNLSDKFAAACNLVDLTEDSDDADAALSKPLVQKMTVAVLKEEITKREEEFVFKKGMKKADLVDALLELSESGGDSNSKASTGASSGSSASSFAGATSRPIVLVLDERLHRLPLESMPCLETRAVSRVTSLPFVFAPSVARCDKVVRRSNAFYVLDPENNLPTTRKTLGGVLEGYLKRWAWRGGFAGEAPDCDFVEKQMRKEQSLFLYCGHGGGEGCFPRSEIEKRFKDRTCHSTVLLFGCSSGRLSSGGGAARGVGRGWKVMEYEPDGVASSYLAAGAPCVLGNLWDVSDRDIDRLCVEFMEQWLEGKGGGGGKEGGKRDVAECISTSRHVCKMRYLVAGAVVCYGVPTVFAGGAKK